MDAQGANDKGAIADRRAISDPLSCLLFLVLPLSLSSFSLLHMRMFVDCIFISFSQLSPTGIAVWVKRKHDPLVGGLDNLLDLHQ